MVPELIDLAAWRAPAARPVRCAGQRALHGAVCGPLLPPQTGRPAAGSRRQTARRDSRISKSASSATVPAPPPGARRRSHLKLEATVTWLGDISRADLAAEYNRADVFCLPSVQEGFGIVLLEAMAAGKPIVAARAAAIPEVAPHAALVEPESAEALAAAILGSTPLPKRGPHNRAKGLAWVEQFDAPRVAQLFVDAVS